jgi:hypothetical protein
MSSKKTKKESSRPGSKLSGAKANTPEVQVEPEIPPKPKATFIVSIYAAENILSTNSTEAHEYRFSFTFPAERALENVDEEKAALKDSKAKKGPGAHKAKKDDVPEGPCLTETSPLGQWEGQVGSEWKEGVWKATYTREIDKNFLVSLENYLMEFAVEQKTFTFEPGTLEPYREEMKEGIAPVKGKKGAKAAKPAKAEKKSKKDDKNSDKKGKDKKSEKSAKEKEEDSETEVPVVDAASEQFAVEPPAVSVPQIIKFARPVQFDQISWSETELQFQPAEHASDEPLPVHTSKIMIDLAPLLLDFAPVEISLSSEPLTMPGGELHLVSPLGLKSLRVVIELKGPEPLLNAEYRNALIPMQLTVKGVTDLPEKPVSFAEMDKLYFPVSAEFKFWNYEPVRLAGLPHAKNVSWNFQKVYLLGLQDMAAFTHYYANHPLEVRLFDRTVLPVLKAHDADTSTQADSDPTTNSEDSVGKGKSKGGRTDSKKDKAGLAGKKASKLVASPQKQKKGKSGKAEDGGGKAYSSFDADDDRRRQLREAQQSCEQTSLCGKAKFLLDDIFKACKFVRVNASVLPVFPPANNSELPNTLNLRIDPYTDTGTTMSLSVRLAGPINAPLPRAITYLFWRVVLILPLETPLLAGLMKLLAAANKKALNLEDQPDRALCAVRLTEQQLADPTFDLLAGFQVVDFKSRIFAFEGMRDSPGMNTLLAHIQSGPGSEHATLLHNPSITFGSRCFQDLHCDIKVIKLRLPLQKMASNPAFYRQSSDAASIACVNKLHAIIENQRLRMIKNLDLFPTCAELFALEQKFGGFVSDFDLTAVEPPRSPKRSAKDAARAQELSAAGGEGEQAATRLQVTWADGEQGVATAAKARAFSAKVKAPVPTLEEMRERERRLSLKKEELQASFSRTRNKPLQPPRVLPLPPDPSTLHPAQRFLADFHPDKLVSDRAAALSDSDTDASGSPRSKRRAESDSLVKKRMDALALLRKEMAKFPNATYSYNADYNSHTVQVVDNQEVARRELERHKKAMRTKEGMRVYGDPSRGRVLDAHLMASVGQLKEPMVFTRGGEGSHPSITEERARAAELKAVPGESKKVYALSGLHKIVPLNQGETKETVAEKASALVRNRSATLGSARAPAPWKRDIGITSQEFGWQENPEWGVSVHRGGEGRELELEQDLQAEKEAWKSKVVVDNTAFYVARNIPNVRKPGVQFASSLSNREGILADPPKKHAFVKNMSLLPKGHEGMNPTSLEPPVSMYTMPLEEAEWFEAHPEVQARQEAREVAKARAIQAQAARDDGKRFNAYSQPARSIFAKGTVLS